MTSNQYQLTAAKGRLHHDASYIANFARFCVPTSVASYFGCSTIEAAEMLAADPVHQMDVATGGNPYGVRTLSVLPSALDLHPMPQRLPWGWDVRDKRRPTAESHLTVTQWLKMFPDREALLNSHNHMIHVKNGKIVKDTLVGSKRMRVYNAFFTDGGFAVSPKTVYEAIKAADAGPQVARDYKDRVAEDGKRWTRVEFRRSNEENGAQTMPAKAPGLDGAVGWLVDQYHVGTSADVVVREIMAKVVGTRTAGAAFDRYDRLSPNQRAKLRRQIRARHSANGKLYQSVMRGF